MADTTPQTAAGTVLLHFTMSLDGFVGRSGSRHGLDDRLLEPPRSAAGVCRDDGRDPRRPDRLGAFPDVSFIYGGAWRGPVFVLTHHPDDADAIEGVTYLSCDVAEATRIALSAAEARISRSFRPRSAGSSSTAVSSTRWTCTPVLLGDGIRLFDNPGGSPIRLELLNATTPQPR